MLDAKRRDAKLPTWTVLAVCLLSIKVAVTNAEEHAADISINDPQVASSDSEVDSVDAARPWQRTASALRLIQRDQLVCQFNFGSRSGLPHFHPIATTTGRVLTWDRPPDHAWHHGLWFCWKFIDGVNYWEHDPRAGKPAGRTGWSDVDVRIHGDHAVVSMTVEYRPIDGRRSVLTEDRRLELTAPDAEGAYRIDWRSSFTVGDRGITLDRTPPKEQSWGGYAGLSIRFAGDFTKRTLNSIDGPVDFNAGDRYRGRAAAMDYSGLIDGKVCGIAFLDHPKNPRYPTPWYAIGGPVMSYLNAALLQEQPLRLDAGERMTLRYRLIVHPNRWDMDRLRSVHARFRQASFFSLEDQ